MILSPFSALALLVGLFDL